MINLLMCICAETDKYEFEAVFLLELELLNEKHFSPLKSNYHKNYAYLELQPLVCMITELIFPQ